jgi:hypothetical protein
LSRSGTDSTGSDIVEISVITNDPPIADAGPDIRALPGQMVQLAGSATDPDGDPIFAWSRKEVAKRRNHDERKDQEGKERWTRSGEKEDAGLRIVEEQEPAPVDHHQIPLDRHAAWIVQSDEPMEARHHDTDQGRRDGIAAKDEKHKRQPKRRRRTEMSHAGRKGRQRWKTETGYHKQGKVENAFFRYNSMIGDRLRSRDPDSQKTEVILGCNILNRMYEHGRPRSVAIRD